MWDKCARTGEHKKVARVRETPFVCLLKSIANSFILKAKVFIACLSTQNNSWKNITKINEILFSYIGKYLHDTQLSHVSYGMGRLAQAALNLIIFERNMQTA